MCQSLPWPLLTAGRDLPPDFPGDPPAAMPQPCPSRDQVTSQAPRSHVWPLLSCLPWLRAAHLQGLPRYHWKSNQAWGRMGPMMKRSADSAIPGLSPGMSLPRALWGRWGHLVAEGHLLSPGATIRAPYPPLASLSKARDPAVGAASLPSTGRPAKATGLSVSSWPPLASR